MYKAFNYSPSKSFYNNTLNHYIDKGSEIYNNHAKDVKDCLSKYISEEGVINGSELKQNWFDIKETDIFISHSHKDINKVKAFAGWLYESYGLTSFIDSCAWGCCDELLNKIDRKYCYNYKSKTYDYDLRNYTTSHVHMMLSTALTDMMDQTECIIFFNTPNSIIMRDELNNVKGKSHTLSPWILYELSMISRLRKRIPSRKLELSKSLRVGRDPEFNIEYDVSKYIDEIITLKDSHLEKLLNNQKIENNILDELYDIVQNEHFGSIMKKVITKPINLK